MSPSKWVRDDHPAEDAFQVSVQDNLSERDQQVIDEVIDEVLASEGLDAISEMVTRLGLYDDTVKVVDDEGKVVESVAGPVPEFIDLSEEYDSPSPKMPWDDSIEKPEYTGGSVSYYQVEITDPTTPGRDPYVAECNDIIEALGMTYAEGNAFKAIWRSCAARNLGKFKAGYKDSLYDAEKVVFFGERMVVKAKRG